MNRSIKDATDKRYHYENHDQQRTHLSGFTPYEYTCKIWAYEPDRFI
jgi:hypothetical protein